MSRGMAKFFDRDRGADGKPLHWSPSQGLPFEGEAPMFLNEDEELQRTAAVANFFCERFNLDDEESKKLYVKVMDRVVNQRAHLVMRKDFDVEVEGKPPAQWVRLEWFEEVLKVVPPGAAGGRVMYTPN